MTNSIFSKFTNQYSLSKTLRFELRPVGKTEKMLRDNNVFQVDENKKMAYEKIKPYFDRLHREFIDEALNNVHLEGIPEYFTAFKEFKADKKSKAVQKTLNDKRKQLRQQVVSFFDAKGKEWATSGKYSHLKIKKSDLNVLFEKEVFQILKDRYGSEEGTKFQDKETEEIISIFDGWEGFTGYFDKFRETRRNFYKAEIENEKGKHGQISTRIIDQNLERFLDNITIYVSIKDKLEFKEVEDFFKIKADEVFSVDYYSKCLLQNGIDTYNDFLGGKTLQNGEKKKGANEIINKYRQDHSGEKLPFLKKLDKQILSEKEKFIDEIETPEQFLAILNKFHASAQEKTTIIKDLLADFFQSTGEYDLQGVFISKEALNTIAHKWTTETDIFNENLYTALKEGKLLSSSAKKKDGGFSFPDFISFFHIKVALEKVPSASRFWKERYYEETNGKTILVTNEPIWIQLLRIFQFEFSQHFERIVKNKETREESKTGYKIFEQKLEGLFDDFNINADSKVVIKDFADETLRIYQMAKYFALEKKRAWDTEYDDSLDTFYTDPDSGYLKFYENAYEEIVQPYNKIRNYLTKKPYSEEKWKLNFDNPTLAAGWDKNKETDNTAVILRKEGRYYLGIMKKGSNQLFSDRNQEQFKRDEEHGYYQKLVYKAISDPVKDIPNLMVINGKTVRKTGRKGEGGVNQLLENLKNEYLPEEINYIRRSGSYLKTADNFNREESQKYLAYYMQRLIEYKREEFEFAFKKPEEYESYSEFLGDVDKQGYKISFEKISGQYIEDKNKAGELFLFEVHNKDWNLKDGQKKTGSKNLHTLYFEELFSQANINHNFPFKLNGEAEIFYRPKTDKENLGIKKNKHGKEVINRKRYAEDKIFFHVPITLNRVSKGTFGFNREINNFLANNPDINIIGVDRGEKHLAYFSVISQGGGILDRGSLNTINHVDYHEKLESKAKEREQARKDWQDLEGIKDLKKGYISQVVRKLADLAIEHNAIIVMEDLNMRFKQIRGGIEKSAYQQLERALIEKLNFLVKKGEVDSSKAGHLLKAYQLTDKFETFKDMGKQTGIIFYTQAPYTSKIDPLTGWRPNFYLKYSNACKAKADILNFSKIEFVNGRFEFTYDLKKFQKQKEYPQKAEWTVCSNVERFRWNKHSNNNKGGYDHYPNLTDNFTQLFQAVGIDVQSGDIIGQIETLEEKGNEKFFKDFIFYFGLICQIRNTQQEKSGNENDFILSPVEPFFDSRNSQRFGENLPQNGDDNGAYNIARKGIVILNKISRFESENGNCDKLSWGDLFISSKEWDDFAAK